MVLAVHVSVQRVGHFSVQFNNIRRYGMMKAALALKIKRYCDFAGLYGTLLDVNLVEPRRGEPYRSNLE